MTSLILSYEITYIRFNIYDKFFEELFCTTYYCSYFLVVIFLPLINRVEVLVRFTAPPPLVPPKVVNALNEVKFPDEPSNKLLNGEKPK